MTLIVNIATYEGIVVASDSKQIQTHKNILTRASENIIKIFPINNKAIASLAGLAFFENQDGIYENVADHINDFSRKVEDSWSVKQIADGLYDYLQQRYPHERQLKIAEETLRAQVASMNETLVNLEQFNNALKFKTKDQNGNIKEGFYNVDPVNILLSGYNSDGTTEIYEMRIPGNVELKRRANDYGCTWIGQGDAVARLILGYDNRMMVNPFFQQLFSKVSQNELIGNLQAMEYNIPWNVMPLQDAIDIAVFLIKTTATIQKFSCGIRGDDHEIPAVGGPIDVAVITPEHGVQWISRKQLHLPSE